jgi:hypothetical protein
MPMRNRTRAALMMRSGVLALGLAVGLSGTAAADQWDSATDSDNGIGTDNVLFHGSLQVHDLAALPGPLADEDWYLLTTHPFSSYQFVVDGMTGDLDLAPGDVQLRAADGTFVTQALGDGAGVRSLNHVRTTGGIDTSFVRVDGAGCGGACDDRDRYRARFYDTTYTIPRFNSTGTQKTVLLIQNTTHRLCSVTVFFLDALGELAAPFASAQYFPFGVAVVDPGVAELSGSVRVAHGCGYGGLSGKAVSVEPATGFTFDTPMVHRPR